jgi:hypothetical protein
MLGELAYAEQERQRAGSPARPKAPGGLEASCPRSSGPGRLLNLRAACDGAVDTGKHAERVVPALP